ncbi:hypothetical protein MMC18_001299 [Xylographa bjoerkii]|nr:hypothetical protein [Xylographa bjoerkii]
MATNNFAELPAELLELILGPFLVFNNPIVVPAYFGSSFTFRASIQSSSPAPSGAFQKQLSVLQVSKKFHDVGVDILYQKRRFHFTDPQGLHSFARSIGAKNKILVSQISIYAVEPDFLVFAKRGTIATSFPNLTQITLERRAAGTGVVARSIMGKIPDKAELVEALRKTLGDQCKIAFYPAE